MDWSGFLTRRSYGCGRGDRPRHYDDLWLAFGFGLIALACAWLVTTGMAYISIRKRLVELHKEWMIRAYVVTFAFVTFRILNDYGPTSRLQPAQDKLLTITWACWVVPLAVTELCFQLRRMRRTLAARH